jgi:outer membrane protein TolC
MFRYLFAALSVLSCVAESAKSQIISEAGPYETPYYKFQSSSSPEFEGGQNAQLVTFQNVAPVGSETPGSSPSVPNPTQGPEQVSSQPVLPYAASQESKSETSEYLKLSDVVASVFRSYPEIIRARQQQQVASGELLGAYGSYDTKLEGYTLSEPTGFYRNYRNGIGVARQTWWGSYLAAGYRIGRGQFQPWYKERETNEGGEFKLSLVKPLLQGRAIDAERVAVFQASIDQRAVAPIVQQAILDISLEASTAYWQWIASGGVLRAQRELLDLAKLRGEQYDAGVKAGKFAEIDLVFNRQLIAERSASTLKAEQKFRATSFKMSLFLRDEYGQPLVPDDAWLPQTFPKIESLSGNDFQTDLAAAMQRRPEPQLLQLELRKLQLDRELATNNRLPRLDMVAETTQDVGTPASPINDKGQLELLVGVTTEVPIQRRKARGKVQSTTGKIAQINQKLRLTEDKIGAELKTAYNAVQLSSQIVDQSQVSFRAALDTLDRYRFAFDRGSVDLIYLNLMEVKANETEVKLVDSQEQWFIALANMQRALGLDPLEQAMMISMLPDSGIKSSGFMGEQPSGN